MQEVLHYLRANGFKTYIVTGGGQDFVRVYAEQSMASRRSSRRHRRRHEVWLRQGRQAVLTKEAKLLLNDNYAGKPEGIHLMIGRRPLAAFGNSTGDRQMLEYTRAATARGSRCWCCTTMPSASMPTVPRKGLPDTKVGTFTQQLYDEAKSSGWTVISMKNDWKRIFAFE